MLLQVCLCVLFRQTLWQGSRLDGCYRQGSHAMAAHAGATQLLGGGLPHTAAFIRAPQLLLVAEELNSGHADKSKLS
jgi:hypothetical protein